MNNSEQFVDKFLMDKGSIDLEDSLMHYKSKYYDPVKAHEYYMRTRQLADKKAKTALTSKAQREAFAYAQRNISKARTRETENLSISTRAHIETLRKTAQATQERISAKIELLAKSLREEVKAPKLNVIPKDATPRQRAFLEAQNRNIAARAARDAQNKYSREAGQGRKEQQGLTRSLQTAVSTVRNDYAASMKALNTKYTKITEKEKAKIRKAIPGAPAKKTKTTTRKKR